MDKFKVIRIMKKYNNKKQRNNIKENNTPNRIPLNKTKTHIKIRSRDIKNLNILTDDESNHRMNITNFPKSRLKQNKTLNNLLTLKLNKKSNKHNSSNAYSSHNPNNNSETYKKLVYLWGELGVNYIYQSIFNKISNSLNKEKKENYFIYELNKLNDIFNIINSIVNDINDRENIIFQLQQNFYEDLNNAIDDDNNFNYDEETIKQIISILLDLRKFSFEIVNNIILLRKEISYDIIMNKYDINKVFFYPNDYLIKMNNDLDFLINTPLNKYFNFSKSDPFLIKLNIVNSNINHHLNNIYELPEIKEENILALINNYEYLVFDELINQEVNLMTMNSKDSFDSIFNFAPKNKIIKKNNIKLNKNKSNISNNIIKANRGLSRLKLRPKENNNKIIIDSEMSKISHTKTINNHIYNYSNKHIIYDDKNYISESNNDEEKNEENHYMKIKPNNIFTNNPIDEDDMKIFEKIIEQSILEKNYIDKELILDNKMTKSRSSNKKSKKRENIEELNINKNKIKEKEEIREEKEGIKGKGIKKELSNYINNILEESEASSQNISDSKIQKYKNKNNIEEKEYNLDNIETEVEPIKKVYSNFSIELYKDKFSSLKSFYANYYKQIPEKLKIGFNIQKNIEKYIDGIYPKILIIKQNTSNEEIIGIVTLNYIPYKSNIIMLGKNKANNYNKSLNISSISCLNESQFSDILINTIDFCKEFFYYENIILQLYYLNKNGQFILYTDLEKIIKNEAKFKWINMENDGINRKIKYKIINTNMNYGNEFNNNIMNLKTVNIIGYETDKNYKTKDIRQLYFINDFSINYLLLEMIGQKNYKVHDNKNDGNNYINMLMNKITFKKINNLCGDFLLSQIGEVSEIKKFIKENENVFNNNEIIKKIDERIFHELYFSLAIININNSFKNIIKRKYNGYIYNILFNDQISEFTIKDKNNNDMKFYLIKSCEQNTSIIIYELKKNETLEDIIKMLINKDEKNHEKNISEVFNNLFAKVTQKPNKINKNIYIPSFKILLSQIAFRPSVFSDVMLENDQNKYKINCLNFIEELTFGVDEPFILQQNLIDLDNFGLHNDILDNFEGNIIIDNDFIINVVDNDLIFELQIPTVSTFIVKRKYWIKSSS